MTRVVYSVPDISCGHCRDTIERILAPLTGVGAVGVDLDARSVEIDYDPDQIDAAQLTAAIESVGYDID